MHVKLQSCIVSHLWELWAFLLMGGFKILLRITAIIFFVEGAIMYALSYFPMPSPQMGAAIDAALLVFISSPFIFWLVIKPHVSAQTRDILQAKEASDRASSTKDEFLAHMSHELRTPLNAIIGFAQLLQHNPSQSLSETQTDYTNSIVYSGEHLLEIINGILDFAAIEASRVHLDMEDIPAASLLDECVALMRPAAIKRNVELVMDASNHHAKLRIRTDEIRLKQAVLNLLSNAIKYNVSGGTVTLFYKVMGDGYLRVSVVDTGKGIAPEHFDKIFLPFDRLGAEATRVIEGTGLGLTVTKKLVELMGGRIGFVSRVGEGSTFWIEMPVAQAQGALVWSDDLSVGIEQIDADHKILVALLNKVSDHSLGHKEVDEILDEMLGYTLYHFKREEAVMAVCGYTNLARHRQSHQRLAEKAVKLTQKWREQQSPEVIRELLEFLRAWLAKHILEEDKGIVGCAQGFEADIAYALEDLERPE